MAEFDMSGSQPLTQANWDKLVRLTKVAIEGADFDTGWIATPADKIIRHNLGVLPSETYVYSSANAQGEPHASDTFTACDRTTITITGPSAYCRVRLKKGSLGNGAL